MLLDRGFFFPLLLKRCLVHPLPRQCLFSAFTSTPAIATEKVWGLSIYVLWSKAVEKWCVGQGLKNELYTKLEDVKKDKEIC